MILTTVKHGRSEKDGDVLAAHLAKTENKIALLAEIGNSLAQTLPELIKAMRVFRDASRHNTKASFHHITINPGQNHGREALIAATHRVRKELDPSGSRMYGIVIHSKERVGEGSSEHAHLIVATVDGNGKCCSDQFLKVRTERLARELEFELGEKATLGRHYLSSLKYLRKTRPEVALWLLEEFGEDPAKPASSLTPGARGRARKSNFNLSKAKLVIRNTWSASGGDVGGFSENLRKVGLEVVSGTKAGVWIVRDEKGLVLGSVDRLLKIPRDEIRRLFENTLEKNSHGSLKKQGTPIPAGVLNSQPKSPESKARTRKRKTISSALQAFGRNLGPPVQERAADKDDSVSSEMWNGAVSIWGIPIEKPRRPKP